MDLLFTKHNELVLSTPLYLKSKDVLDRRTTVINQTEYITLIKPLELFYLDYIGGKFTLNRQPCRILVEHTSANPDYGNFHIGNFSNSIVGEYIAKFYSFNGAKVIRGYYLNDCGQRVRALTVVGTLHPTIPHTKLYTVYKTLNLTDEVLNKRYLALPVNERTELANKIVEANTNALLDLLKQHNICFDIVYKESNYIDLDIVPYTKENDAMYYELDYKRVYVKSSQSFPLYTLGDLGFTIKEKLGYDRVFTVVGRDQQLHFTTLLSILQREGYTTTNLKFVYISSMLLEGKKLKKSGGAPVVRVVDLLALHGRLASLFIKLVKYYILSKLLARRGQELSYDTYLQSVPLLALYLLKVPKKQTNLDLGMTTSQLHWVQQLLRIRYGYRNHTAFFNELKPITHSINTFFEYYTHLSVVSALDNLLYDAYSHTKTTVMGFVGFQP